MEFRNFIDQVLSSPALILTVIGICVTYWIFIKQKKKYALSYLVREHKFAPGIKEKQTLIDVDYENTGNQVLLKNHFHSPITTQFTKARIESAKLLGNKSENPTITGERSKENYCEFIPTLINPRESVTVRYTVSDFEGRIHVAGRIENIQRIGNKASEDFIQNRVVFMLLTLVLIGIGLYYGDTTLPLLESWKILGMLSIPYWLFTIIHFYRLTKEQYLIMWTFQTPTSKHDVVFRKENRDEIPHANPKNEIGKMDRKKEKNKKEKKKKKGA